MVNYIIKCKLVNASLNPKIFRCLYRILNPTRLIYTHPSPKKTGRDSYLRAELNKFQSPCSRTKVKLTNEKKNDLNY